MILLHLTDTPAFPEGVQEVAVYHYLSIQLCLRTVEVVPSLLLRQRLQFLHVHRLALLVLAFNRICEVPAEFLAAAEQFLALRRTDFSIGSPIFET